MRFKYRAKMYDTEVPFEVNNLRDLGAYVILRYPTVEPTRVLFDFAYDRNITMYIVDRENRIKCDRIMKLPSYAAFMNPEYFAELEKRIEKVLVKRGFI